MLEQLPYDIEQKLKNLPTIDFSDQEAFQKVIVSTDFNDIFDFYQENYLPDSFKSKSEVYKRVALYLIITNQDTELLEQMDTLLYRRPVPTIEEFLDHPRYMGLQNSSMYPYWKTKLCEIFAPTSEINRVLWSGATGTGKMEDKNTIIPTPQGYKRVGDMLKGEYLWGKNGKPTKIVNIFEKGIREMFKVTFDDGTFIRCGGDHLWEIVNYTKGGKKRVRDTNWLFTHSLQVKGKQRVYKYGVEYCQPVEYPETVYVVDPYELGLLLSDGDDKCIPEEYLLGSVEQRLNLLRGLMDMCGSITVRKSTHCPRAVIFKAVSKQLANGVAELVRSLGGKAVVRSHEYSVYIWMNLNPFSLPEKAALFKPYIAKRKIISVTRDGTADARCFEVDSEDHLYLTRHYIPTHNTVTARKAVIYSLYKLLCLRYPRSVLGVEEGSTLAVFVLSVTQKSAYQTNLEPLIRILSNMPCFQRVQNMKAFENFDLEDPRCPFPFFVDKANLTVVFKDNIIITLGSSIANTVGYDIVISACLSGNTKVVTNYGNKKIKDLEKFIKNRNVYTYSMNAQGQLEKSKIIAAKQTNIVTEMMRLWIDDDFYLECTTNHLIPIQNPSESDKYVQYIHDLAYKKAQYLTEADEIYSYAFLDSNRDVPFVDEKNLFMKFKKVEKISVESTPVYNLTVDNPNHNFLVSINNQTCMIVKNCDEINEAGVEKGMELLNSIDGRLDSRFKGSKFIFQNVMSSARSTESVTREYSKKWAKDTGFLYLHPMRFEVKEGSEFKGTETFPILIGNGIIPSKIIEDPRELKAISENTYTPPSGCEIVQVPTIYRNQFEAQLEQQIQDILGIDTQDTKNVFRDTTLLEDSLLTPEMYLEVNIKDNTEILPLIEKYNIFEQTLEGNWQFKRAPRALRYCHIDLSGGGDSGQCDTGICIGHKEYQVNPVTGEKETVYVVDLQLFINAKNKVDIHSVQTFLVDLVTEKNIPIHTISADQFQCLAGDTKIDLLDGSTKTIKELIETYDKKDLYTYTYDTDNMKIVSGKIIGGKKTGHKQIYEITLDNGEKIKCTEDHLFLLKSGTYKKAIELQASDDLMTLYKDEMKKGYEAEQSHKIVAIKKLGFEDVYDIQIDNFPNFALSAGVFVHNSLMMLQQLEASGCFTKVNKLSVDIKLEPYTNAATLIEKGLVRCGKCPKLRKELEALVLNKGKVTRTTELKDGPDSLVGFIWNAQLNYTDQPFYEYATIEREKSVIGDYNRYIQTDERLFDL